METVNSARLEQVDVVRREDQAPHPRMSQDQVQQPPHFREELHA